MKRLITTPLVLGAAFVASAPAYVVTAAYASTSTTIDGWVRLANLSPATGTCDLYLYSFGNSKALMVLSGVDYGHVSAYTALPAGDYTVDMRMSGQSATSPAVATTALMLMGSRQYTVAAMGTGTREQFQVIDDSSDVTAGKSAIRILQAANATTETADIGQQQVGSDLKFGDITHYQTVAAGTQLVSVSTRNGQATDDLQLSPNSTHTLVVLNGSNGPQISELSDATGTATEPTGGAATGFGGTAPKPLSSPLPWLAMIAGGAVAAVIGRRRRSSTPASR
jgi:Domain of unknown function (DUF4397)